MGEPSTRVVAFCVHGTYQASLMGEPSTRVVAALKMYQWHRIHPSVCEPSSGTIIL